VGGGGRSSLELIDRGAMHGWPITGRQRRDGGRRRGPQHRSGGGADNGAVTTAADRPGQIGLLEWANAWWTTLNCCRGLAERLNLQFGLESGLTGWTPQGCHIRSSLETTGGYLTATACTFGTATSSGRGQLRAGALNTRLWRPADRDVALQGPLAQGLAEPLIRVHGNWLGSDRTGWRSRPIWGRPACPTAGRGPTPGRRFYEVTHAPGLPAASQSVHRHGPVSRSPMDSKRRRSYYRIDPATTYTAWRWWIRERRDGLANDGIYSASIPRGGGRDVVAFLLQATDGLGATTTFPADQQRSNTWRARGCLL